MEYRPPFRHILSIVSSIVSSILLGSIHPDTLSAQIDSSDHGASDTSTMRLFNHYIGETWSGHYPAVGWRPSDSSGSRADASPSVTSSYDNPYLDMLYVYPEYRKHVIEPISALYPRFYDGYRVNGHVIDSVEGAPAFDAFYVDGLLHGKATFYYSGFDDLVMRNVVHGSLKAEGAFIHGRFDGVWSYYDERGRIIQRRTFAATREYPARIVNYWTYGFDLDGGLTSIIELDSNGTVTYRAEYNGRGSIERIYTITDRPVDPIILADDPTARLHDYTGYYPDGRLSNIGTYVIGRRLFKQIGEHRAYDEQGKVAVKEHLPYIPRPD